MIQKYLTLSFLSTLIILLAVSCTSSVPKESMLKLKSNPYPGNQKPQILAVYHPYPDFNTTVESSIRPLPGYNNWSDNRMERDLQRMRSVGLNGVLLAIKPEDLADNIRFERIRHFYELAAVQQPVFHVALLLGGNNELTTDNVSQFVFRKGLADISSAFKLNGKVVVVFEQKVRLVQKDKTENETFCYRQIGKNWPAVPAGNLICRPALPDHFAWVRIGDNHVVSDNNGVPAFNVQDAWALPRGKGLNFANRLRNAFHDQAAIICIQSWNDFSDGSFMEPNTLDRNIMMTVLQKELEILEK